MTDYKELQHEAELTNEEFYSLSSKDQIAEIQKVLEADEEIAKIRESNTYMGIIRKLLDRNFGLQDKYMSLAEESEFEIKALKSLVQRVIDDNSHFYDDWYVEAKALLGGDS